MYDPDEVQDQIIAELLTIMQDKEQRARDRLRAAELLGVMLELIPCDPT